MKPPNFFLAGAPKCGTTAMSVYLGEHPAVFFCEPKEPCFWADDMPGIRESYRLSSLDRYLALFEGAGEGHVAVGEGSTNYLVSEVALKNILAFNPAARIILMVRHPVELAHSLHAHNYFSGWDDEADFQRAWSLQAERAQSGRVPAVCLNPKMLQYRTVASAGWQVQRAIECVPRSQLLIVLFDDFRASPGDVYRRILEFLELPDDGRSEFPAVNESMAPRSLLVTRALQSAPARGLTRALMATLSGPLYRMADRAKKSASSKKQQRVELESTFRDQLLEAFREDTDRLAQLIGRDLSSWRL